VIHYGLRGPAAVLDERAQLQLRQALILKLRVLVPAIFLPALVFAAAFAIREGGASGAGFRIAGIVALLIWIAIRVVGTVPINSATLRGSSTHRRQIGKRKSSTRSVFTLPAPGRRSSPSRHS
jgi:hypothetical protein